MHVVLLDQRHAALEALLARPAMHLGRVGLAVAVARMRLAGEHDLQRALAVGQDAAQTLGFAEDERCALVGGEAAREADGERVGVEGLTCAKHHLGRLAAAARLTRQPFTDELHQSRTQLRAHGPEFACIGLLRGCPRILATLDRVQIEADRTLPECLRLGCEPRARMHAVGDMADGHQRGIRHAVHLLPHLAAHAAVQRRHAVHMLRRAQCQHGHAERRLRVGGPLRAHVQERTARQTGLAPAGLQGVGDHLGVVSIVARGHRRVRGEHGAGADALQRVLERFTLATQLRQARHAGERGMTLVQVEHAGLDAERLQRHHAAHTQQHLLTHAQLGLALVQTLGQTAVLGAIGLAVGVHQHGLHATHAHGP